MEKKIQHTGSNKREKASLWNRYMAFMKSLLLHGRCRWPHSATIKLARALEQMLNDSYRNGALDECDSGLLGCKGGSANRSSLPDSWNGATHLQSELNFHSERMRLLEVAT